MVSVGYGWFQVVSNGFGWFAVLVVTIFLAGHLYLDNVPPLATGQLFLSAEVALSSKP